MPSLRDRWRDLRNSILTDPRFHRYASTSWLLAPIARRQAASLFDLVAGFVYSQILFACVRTGLLEALRAGPLGCDQIAGGIGLGTDATRRLLTAAAPLGLVERHDDGRYGLGMHGAAVMADGGIRAMILHHAAFYRDLVDPLPVLEGKSNGGEMARYWPYAEGARSGDLSDEDVATYTELMAAAQTFVAGQVIASYSFARRRCLLDVGGGNGTFLAAVGRRWPKLRLQLFDLPPVAERARENLAIEGLGDRVEVFGGDFHIDPLPRGADTISLVRVLHDHDDAPALQLLKRIRDVMAPGAELIIAEPLAETAGARRLDSYFGIYLRAMGSGRTRRFDEVRGMLEAAGFAKVRALRVPLPLQTSVVVAVV